MNVGECLVVSDEKRLPWEVGEFLVVTENSDCSGRVGECSSVRK